MTKSNVAGYVGAFPIPEVLQGINAFTRGMRSVNPDAEVRVIWVNSWFDPGKERDAALALRGQGAEMVTNNTDSTATMQTAEAQGRSAMATPHDMSKFGHKDQLTTVTQNRAKQFNQANRHEP